MVAKFSSDNDNGGSYTFNKGPMLCRAEGCQCWAQSGTRGLGNEPDSPGRCLYHGAIDENPEGWRKMTELLQNAAVRQLIYLCAQLEKLPIDRSEMYKLDGSLIDDAFWKNHRWNDSNYLTYRVRDLIDSYTEFFSFDPSVRVRNMGEAKDGREYWQDPAYESPKAYGLRVHRALMAKLVLWSVPHRRPAVTGHVAPSSDELAKFLARNRAFFPERRAA